MNVVRLYVVALWATSFDIMSTVTGINALGWGCHITPAVQFCEANPVVRAFFPMLGVLAPVVYLPLEALWVVVLGFGTFQIGRVLLSLLVRFHVKVHHPERAEWFYYYGCLLPLMAAAFNTLVTFGFIRP